MTSNKPLDFVVDPGQKNSWNRNILQKFLPLCVRCVH